MVSIGLDVVLARVGRAAVKFSRKSRRRRGDLSPAEIVIQPVGDRLRRTCLRLGVIQRKHDCLARDELAAPEVQQQYISAKVFFGPAQTPWEMLRLHGATFEIGAAIDAGIEAVEKANPALRGFLPRDYARPELDQARLKKLVDLVSTGGFS